MECIFCKISNGEIPSYTIYEDDTVKAFLDANPDANGHTLIIPKKHYQDLFDIDEKTLMHIIKIAKKLDPTFKEKLGAKGVTLVQNNGILQEVKHFHLHLKPGYSGNHKKMKIEDIYEKLHN